MYIRLHRDAFDFIWDKRFRKIKFSAKHIFYIYFVDRASCHKFLLITNLMHFSMYLFINFISLHVSSIKCSSSGNRIVLVHHLV